MATPDYPSRVTTPIILRPARPVDLEPVVAIYNATIPGRQATADTAPVTVASRREWFDAHTPDRRPLWVAEDDRATVVGWLSLSDFYGRPAYGSTAEVSVYVADRVRGTGLGGRLLDHALVTAPDLGLDTLLGFIFAHNLASLGLFGSRRFERWGLLPDVAVLDGVTRSLAILGRRLSG